MNNNQAFRSKFIVYALLAVITIFVIISLYSRNRSQHPVATLGKQVVDSTLSCDLDGNGTKETILYASSGKLSINGIEYTEHLDIQEQSNPFYDGFYLVDIDANDSYKEIALCSYGRSDDLSSFYYYYKDNELIPMGLLEGFPDDELYMRAIKKESEGILKAPLRLSILQTWWGYQSYELNDEHQISSIPQEYYEPTIPYYSPLLQPLILYKSPDLTADTLEIDQQDMQFILTDNKQWCKVKTQKGEEGWFYIENGRINGTSEPTDVFSTLALYD